MGGGQTEGKAKLTYMHVVLVQ